MTMRHDGYPQSAERVALVRAMDSYDRSTKALREMMQLSRTWLHTLPMPGRRKTTVPRVPSIPSPNEKVHRSK